MHSDVIYKTRLTTFLMWSLLAHMVMIPVIGIILAKTSPVKAPPPIKVKYEEPQKQKQRYLLDAPKTKKIEPPKQEKILAEQNSQAHSNLNKKKAEEYQRKKTVIPRVRRQAAPPAPPKPVPPKPERPNKVVEVAKTPEKPPTKQEQPLPESEKGFLPKVVEETRQVQAPRKTQPVKKNALALLDGLDTEKFASFDTESKALEDLDDGELVSLDTRESKYASYFARIKHQIERVWTYPYEAVQRGVSGEATLRFRISKEGNLMGVVLIDKSGHEILDFAAVKAVKEAAPFYPFPVTIKKNSLAILATFIYTPAYDLGP